MARELPLQGSRQRVCRYLEVEAAQGYRCPSEEELVYRCPSEEVESGYSSWSVVGGE
jgi:hypothetical protein